MPTIHYNQTRKWHWYWRCRLISWLVCISNVVWKKLSPDQYTKFLSDMVVQWIQGWPNTVRKYRWRNKLKQIPLLKRRRKENVWERVSSRLVTVRSKSFWARLERGHKCVISIIFNRKFMQDMKDWSIDEDYYKWQWHAVTICKIWKQYYILNSRDDKPSVKSLHKIEKDRINQAKNVRWWKAIFYYKRKRRWKL